MSEEPKSIWKKPLKLPGIFLAWLALMVATMLTFSIVIMIIGDSFNKPSDFIGLLIFGAVVATLLLGLWLFIRWLCCWRNFRRFLFGLACFATLIALFYAEEDWRGWHEWQNYKHEWEAKGEKLDYKDYAPAAVPDEENFALTPVMASCYASMLDKTGHEIWPRNTNVVDRTRMPLTHDDAGWPTNGGSWGKATLTDLKPWQDYYRGLAATTNFFPVAPQPQTAAQDVLLALSKYDATVEDLRAAAKLPFSRFPLEYDKDDPAEILLPHLAGVKRISQLLQLRALAELQDGQSEKALADIQLNFRLMDSVRSEPFIISHLVRFAMLQINLQPVYEGLAEHQWTDAQLMELDAELAKLDCLADYAFSIRSEPAFHIRLIDYLEQKRSRCEYFFSMVDQENSQGKNGGQPHEMNTLWNNVLFRLAPRGWFYQNEIRIAERNRKWNEPMVDATDHIVSPQIVAQGKAAESGLARTPYSFLARTLFFWLGEFSEKTAFAQSSVDLARTAIALERYRLAHGEFPESLDVLAPQFIPQVPHDVIGGRPLKYRRASDGQFVLYSIGWNEKDDGGIAVIKKGASRDESPHEDADQGDWVWQYPVK